jgi:hypothetical protein
MITISKVILSGAAPAQIRQQACADTVSFGVTADYASSADLDVFIEGIQCGLAELKWVAGI